ncbi:glycerate kinase [Arcanobacterium bovis]|uniref:Uncharacterized protein n=1 Tax=Arcanobacterium bovis TaxID=2529275 RepID=A0A4Q9V168_9ACTO|nr:glycerate kinase [Arcanobacterium bovis]TBW22826.1 hypothetical protein EZJ44_02675 [Arcanobacterium bovis]
MSGLEPSCVSDAFRRGWARVRPADDHLHLLSCEGNRIAKATTGLVDWYANTWDTVVSRSTDEAVAFIAERKASSSARAVRRGVVDIAASHSWVGSALPYASSDFLAQLVRDLLAESIDELHVHLPRFCATSDLGIGFLGAFTGRGVSFYDDVDPQWFVAAVEEVRAALKGVNIVVTYGAEQELLGVSGMAKAWTDRGVAGQEGQDFGRHAGTWIHEIKRNLPDLGSPAGVLHVRSGSAVGRSDAILAAAKPFAGVGGGLGFVFDLCGAQIWPMSEFAVRSGGGDGVDLSAELAEYDLVCYVTGVIGESIPRGLTLVSDYAQEHGVPVILVAQSAGLRRGDLPRFGLAGAYEVLEGNSWSSPEDHNMCAIVDGEELANLAGRIARTWGWE